MPNCVRDQCDNDPSEYMLCERWQSGHPICRGSYDMTYAKWREASDAHQDSGSGS